MHLPLLSTSLKHIYEDGNIPTTEDIYKISSIPVSFLNSQDSQASQVRVKRKIIQKIVFDVFGIVLMLLLIYCFYIILKPPLQYFQLKDSSISYPLLIPTVPSVLVAVFSITLPIFVIILYNIFFAWNIWDVYAGIIGPILAYVTALLFTSTLWFFVGGIRPHFLSICKIDYEMYNNTDVFHNEKVCLNYEDFTQDTFHGFPSGHASTAFAGCTFLSSYLASHLQIYQNGNIFKLFVVSLPLISAIWLSTARLADHNHNPIQLAVGILIGITSANFMYKITYLQGFWLGYGRWAHIPSAMIFP